MIFEDVSVGIEMIDPFLSHLFGSLDNIIINNALIISELMIPGEVIAITGNDNLTTLIMCHSVEYKTWPQPAGQLIVGNFFFLAVNCKLR